MLGSLKETLCYNALLYTYNILINDHSKKIYKKGEGPEKMGLSLSLIRG